MRQGVGSWGECVFYRFRPRRSTDSTPERLNVAFLGAVSCQKVSKARIAVLLYRLQSLSGECSSNTAKAVRERSILLSALYPTASALLLLRLGSALPLFPTRRSYRVGIRRASRQKRSRGERLKFHLLHIFFSKCSWCFQSGGLQVLCCEV